MRMFFCILMRIHNKIDMHHTNLKYGNKSINLFVVAFIVCLLQACGNDSDVGAFPEPIPDIGQEMLINWNVYSSEMQSARSLIGNDEALQTACSPDKGGQAIGIWSAYELGGIITENVLGADGDVSLIYKENTDDDNYEGWTYAAEAAHWEKGANYFFNAYFPQDAIEIIGSSDITTFVARYNSKTTQEDLMLAYSEVDTKDNTFIPSNPVPLDLHHALAALRFHFVFTTPSSDQLISCWLENTVKGKGLTTQGLLQLGVGGIGNQIRWALEDVGYQPVGTPFYEWNHETGINITFDQENPATAYIDNDDCLYASHDGWLLILPQESDGTLKFNFTTSAGGDVIHSVMLPTVTGIDAQGREDPTGNWYYQSQCYTYIIKITPTGATVTLSIKPWNQLDSSYDITF